eukprot:gene46563-23963_t
MPLTEMRRMGRAAGIDDARIDRLQFAAGSCGTDDADGAPGAQPAAAAPAGEARRSIGSLQ